jgi:hypothetical protein
LIGNAQGNTIVNAGSVRRHTIRGMRKITNAVLLGSAALAAAVSLMPTANAYSDETQALRREPGIPVTNDSR